jgi:hypothetical protein
MIDYGEQTFEPRGLGDPLNVDRHTRPVADSVDRWADELAAEPVKLAIVREMVAALDDADLDTWGFPRASFFAPVEQAAARGGRTIAPARNWNRFVLERKLLTFLRRHSHDNFIERWLRRVRMLCDVLLRG